MLRILRNNVGGNTIQALDLVGADIRGNMAVGNGGGIYLGSGVGLHQFLLSRSAVWENEATLGGGVYILGSSDTLYQIANSMIGQNLATQGGGIYLALGDLDIRHSTVWDNQNEQLVNNGPLAAMGNSIIGFASPGGSGCNVSPIQLGPNRASDGSCGASIVGDPELRVRSQKSEVARSRPRGRAEGQRKIRNSENRPRSRDFRGINPRAARIFTFRQTAARLSTKQGVGTLFRNESCWWIAAREGLRREKRPCRRAVAADTAAASRPVSR